MLDLPQWAHELATLATLAAASGWLVVHFVGVSRGREQGSGGCASCEQNAAPQPAAAPARGRRSSQLRVL